MDTCIKKYIEKYTLTDKEFKYNVENVFNELSINVNSCEEKQFIIVGGQAGSGKTNLVHKEYQKLKRNAIIIDQDELRTKFPPNLNNEIVNKFDEKTGYLILRPYVEKLLDEIMKRSRENNYNVIFETALSRVDPIIEYINKFIKDGYNIKFSILAVHELEAQLSMLYRYSYLLQKDGFCRRASKMKANSYNIILENINVLLDFDLLNKIEVYMRNNDINGFPIKLYSANNDNYSKEILRQAIRRGELSSYKEMEKNFEQRYNFIKKILEKYSEQNKIVELDSVRNKYLSLKYKDIEER